MTVAIFRKRKSNARSRSKPTVVDGIWFRSKVEADRFCELRYAERAGEIRELKRQVRFELTGGESGFVVERYCADFTYHEKQDGAWVFIAEDVKGKGAPLTSDYIRKRKWMRAVHGIEIREVRL